MQMTRARSCLLYSNSNGNNNTTGNRPTCHSCASPRYLARLHHGTALHCHICATQQRRTAAAFHLRPLPSHTAIRSAAFALNERFAHHLATANLSHTCTCISAVVVSHNTSVSAGSSATQHYPKHVSQRHLCFIVRLRLQLRRLVHSSAPLDRCHPSRESTTPQATQSPVGRSHTRTAQQRIPTRHPAPPHPPRPVPPPLLHTRRRRLSVHADRRVPDSPPAVSPLRCRQASVPPTCRIE